MNASLLKIAVATDGAAPLPVKIFTACAEKYALLCALGEMNTHTAVDCLQSYAEWSGLVVDLGQDRVQDILAAAFIWAEEVCGEAEDEDPPSDYAAQLVRQWELNDERDNWKHTGGRPPTDDVRNSDVSGKPARHVRTNAPPQSSVDAFKHVVGLGDADHLARWLRDHSDVAPALLDQMRRAA